MKRALLLISTVTSAATAQVPLRGVAYDSLHGRPLPGAFVGIVGMNVSAMSDSLGRFVLPGVPLGTHRVVMQHDVLDAIGLSAAGARAVVNSERDSVIVAVPSFATLWRAACGAAPLPPAAAGFMFGTVARANRPVPQATVSATWLDLSTQKQMVMEVAADSTGNFALCGVPTTSRLSLRASTGASVGAWTETSPLDKERIARRDLAIAAASTMRFDVPSTTTGTGSVERAPASRITTIDSVRGPANTTPRDSAMRLFEENRRIGIGRFFSREDLEKSRDRRMSDVLGQLPGMKAQTGSGGQGWILPNRGVGTKVNTSINTAGSQAACEAPRQDSPGGGGRSCATACYPHVYVDGIDISPNEVPNLNRFTPDQLEAIEFYASAGQVPRAYNRLNRSSCGIFVLHTRRGRI